jgi:hypothetical protein
LLFYSLSNHQKIKMSTLEQVQNSFYLYSSTWVSQQGGAVKTTAPLCCPESLTFDQQADGSIVVNSWGYATPQPSVEQLQTLTVESVNAWRLATLPYLTEAS